MKIIYKDGTVAECPAEEAQHVLRHTAAHIMAQAIQHLYPDADFAYGPATEKGFYYDVDFGDKKLTDEDLEAIEKEMKKIVKANLPSSPSSCPGTRPSSSCTTVTPSIRRSTSATCRGCRHQLLPAGRLYRYVRRPPPDLHQGPEGL